MCQFYYILLFLFFPPSYCICNEFYLVYLWILILWVFFGHASSPLYILPPNAFILWDFIFVTLPTYVDLWLLLVWWVLFDKHVIVHVFGDIGVEEIKKLTAEPCFSLFLSLYNQRLSHPSPQEKQNKTLTRKLQPHAYLTYNIIGLLSFVFLLWNFLVDIVNKLLSLLYVKFH